MITTKESIKDIKLNRKDIEDISDKFSGVFAFESLIFYKFNISLLNSYLLLFQKFS